jgi:hypothetical protein
MIISWHGTENKSNARRNWLSLPIIATITRLLCRDLTLQNEYLRAENKILLSKIKSRIMVLMIVDSGIKFGLIRAIDLQQNLQQTCSFELLLRFGCASVSIITLYLTSINPLFTNTYKHGFGTHNPLVEGSIPSGPICNPFIPMDLRLKNFLFLSLERHLKQICNKNTGHCYLSYFSIVNLNTFAISFPSAGIFKISPSSVLCHLIFCFVPRIVYLLFYAFYHAGTIITIGTVSGGKVNFF